VQDCGVKRKPSGTTGVLLLVDAFHAPNLEAFHERPIDVLQERDFLSGQKFTKLADGDFVAVRR